MGTSGLGVSPRPLRVASYGAPPLGEASSFAGKHAIMMMVSRLRESPATKFFRRSALHRVIVALCFAPLPVSAQLPPSGTLSDSDWPLFRAEIARLEKLLSSAPD